MQMVGDKAFITSVKPKSDAEAKGLKAGDQVLSFENFRPNRKELWKLNYYYYLVSPRSKLRLNVLHPGGAEPVDIEFAAKIRQRPRTLDLTSTLDFSELIRDSDAGGDAHYIAERGDTVIWKMLTFSDDPARIESLMDSRGKKGKNLILDLRGNGGGYVESLERLAGHFFDQDLKIADRKGRPEKKKENEPMTLKGRKDYFQGKLIVLIDHESGSASEIFARLMQLEKRGVVLGDVSAGAVMQSLGHPLTMVTGISTEVGYGVSVTNADVIMSDGKSVEHMGVTPDELVLPTAEDIREGRDPVLARAMEILGQKMTPQEAYKIFEKAYKWNDN
jgi:carboxyl-terminal processing protease